MITTRLLVVSIAVFLNGCTYGLIANKPYTDVFFSVKPVALFVRSNASGSATWLTVKVMNNVNVELGNSRVRVTDLTTNKRIFNGRLSFHKKEGGYGPTSTKYLQKRGSGYMSVKLPTVEGRYISFELALKSIDGLPIAKNLIQVDVSDQSTLEKIVQPG